MITFLPYWIGGSLSSFAAWAVYVHVRDWAIDTYRRKRLNAVYAAIDAAKSRRAIAAKGLKQPNQSSTVRYFNARITELTCEQLRLEAVLGKGA